jgi:diguanylate cyclase (GGDEF)-like protein/PAS domain S-box-containing protein
VSLTGRSVERASQMLLASIVRSTDAAVIGITPDGVISSWNTGAERLYGYLADEVIGEYASVLVPPRRLAAERAVAAKALLGEHVDSYEAERLSKDGSRGTISVSVAPIRGADGSVVGVSSIEHPVSERRRADQTAQEAEAYLESAFRDAPIAMGLVSIQAHRAGAFLVTNPALCRLSGFSADQLARLDFQALTHPDDLDRDLAALAELIAGEARSYQLEQRLIQRDHQVAWVLLNATLVRDTAGMPLYSIRQLENIDERKQFEGQLEHLADHDPLTGLFNRRRFARELSHELAYARRYGGSGAVLLVDVDNFKYVNDTLGHSVGDEVITAAGQLLQRRVRETDVLARLGGDEFAVLLPRAGEDDARILAAGLLASVRGGAILVGTEQGAHLTISVGIALFDAEREMTADELLVNADLAMYAAKDGGRDRFAFSTPEQQARMEEGLTWTERIRQALDENLFVVCYQPILDLSSERISQYEALLRLPGANGELIPPATFIYTAERFGLIRAIDRWVLHHACRTIAERRDAGREVRLEINLSGQSLGDPELPEFIEQELSATSIDPASLILEVTETAAIVNMNQTRKLIARIGELGCGFALDDFGAGFGSFYYLKHLPLDYLKIDGEFIRNLPASTADQLIVKAIVQMSQGLGTRTIAEFVTDQATVELLQEHGVDYAQGYHIGRPKPLAETWPN